MRRSALSLILASVFVSLLGVGCLGRTRDPLAAYPSVTVPVNFPDDILRYPGARIYSASLKNNLPVLGQATTATMPEVITWLNQSYPAAKKDLHLFQDRGSSKLYSFQDSGYRYNTRLEYGTTSSTVKILTQKVPIAQDGIQAE